MISKILVTGGAGFIGSHAVRALIAAGYGVVVVDNLSKGFKAAIEPKAKFIQLDLNDQEALEKVFAAEKIEAVLHFAGSIEVGLSMIHPEQFFENNLLNGVKLLEAMRKNGVNKIIFSSTAAVYGNPKSVPIREDAELNPTNFYGQSKLMFEQVLKKYDEIFGFKFAALRYFNAAGADMSGQIGQAYDPPTHIIPRFVRALLAAKNGETVDFQVNGNDYPTPDGTCIRDYIHVSDLVDAHVLALQYLFDGGASDVFNLGNGQGFSVQEVIDVAQKVSGYPLKYEFGARRAGDPARLVADAQKARTILNWKPQYASLEDIVGSAWRWHEGHPKGY